MIIDAHSKWLDIHITNSCNGQITIEKLRMTFASQGLPEMVVLDNGPAFVSNEFEEFMRKNGIRHIKSPGGTIPHSVKWTSGTSRPNFQDSNEETRRIIADPIVQISV